MHFKHTLVNKKRFHHNKFVLAVFLFCALLLSPLSFANAACCRCTHPEITAGEFCLSKDISNCASLGSTNPELASANCKIEQLDSLCRQIQDGGICINNPNTSPLAFKLSDFQTKKTSVSTSGDSNDNFQPLLLQLNVDIPNLALTTPEKVDQSVAVPYLGQYIQALYKFLIGVSLIAAALMIVVGGFKYVMAATGAKVESAKQMIIDALMGLVIILGAYAILANINPNLTKLPSLYVPYIQGVPWELVEGSPSERPSETLRSEGNAADKEMLAQDIARYAKEFGVDACSLLTICYHESGFKWRWDAEFTGRSQYAATAIGYCGTHVQFFLDNGAFGNRTLDLLRKKFPEFPSWSGGDRKMTTEEKNERIDWVIAHPQVSSFVAAFAYRGVLSTAKNNEVQGIARYGAGSGSMNRWIKATGCKIQSNLTVVDALSQGTDAVLAASCVPYGVVIPSRTANECESDNYICADLKAIKGKGSTLYGHCPSNKNQDCVGMKTDEFARYVISKYPQIQAQFPFCK